MSDEKNLYGGIFDMSAEEIISRDGFGESNADPDFYRPSLTNENLKDKNYKSRIRFVPNALDRELQKVSKWIYYMPDPDQPDKSFYVDCLSNNPNDPRSRNNIITTAFFMCKEHDSKVIRDIGKRFFNRKRFHWMLVQIMQDVNQKELEGSVKIYRFGQQINDKIEAEGKADPSVGKKAVNVIDPFTGKDFILWIDEKEIEQNKIITSYDRSYFDDTLTSISLGRDQAGDFIRAQKNEEDMKKIYEFLKTNSPDLSKVIYTPWDEQMEQKVIESVRVTIDDEILFDKIYKKAYGKKGNFTPKAKSDDKPSMNIGDPEIKEEAPKEEAPSKTPSNVEDLQAKVTQSEPKEDAKQPQVEEREDFNFDEEDFNFEEIDNQ